MIEQVMDRSDIKMNLSFKITDYFDQHFLILESIKKAIAQAHLTLSDDFLDYSSETIHYYLWALCDSLERIKNMLDGFMINFLQIK